uniref:MFS transporter n=1 Tax=Altererythrobacter segetis TaxID=1104773 RepID=UPI003C2B9EDF
MPRAIRATSVTIIMMGSSCGTASAGPIANWTAPALGWEGIFWVCGIMTGAFALILFFMLPESARWRWPPVNHRHASHRCSRPSARASRSMSTQGSFWGMSPKGARVRIRCISCASCSPAHWPSSRR